MTLLAALRDIRKNNGSLGQRSIVSTTMQANYVAIAKFTVTLKVGMYEHLNAQSKNSANVRKSMFGNVCQPSVK